MQEEIFGPILPMLTYRNLDEAIQRIDASGPGLLALYLFTRRHGAWSDKVLGSVRFGGGCVNDTVHAIWPPPHMPFGGVGESGIGRLSRPVELPHLLPRKEHPQALGQARYRPALRALQGQNGQAEEADLRPISNPRCRRNGGGGASLFERVSAEIVGFVRVGNGANGKKTCLRIFRKFPRRETCRFPKERGEANRQT